MKLEDGFHFSQASLQDYVDCRRRFLLRYVYRQAWPAVETEPVLENERYMRQGADFHRMLQQHALGLPRERLEAFLHDPDLLRWWVSYTGCLSDRADLGGLAGFDSLTGAYPELTLSAAFEGHRLVAKYDLVLASPDGRAAIIDWKTSRKHPKHAWLAGRLQTRLYPYLLSRAGVHLNRGRPFQPEQVQMIYWFSDFPDQPERFIYSEKKYQDDEAYLAGLVGEILRLVEGGFSLTPHEERCSYCVYRSLCDRGVRAASWENAEAVELEELVDFEQAGEIEL